MQYGRLAEDQNKKIDCLHGAAITKEVNFDILYTGKPCVYNRRLSPVRVQSFHTGFYSHVKKLLHSPDFKPVNMNSLGSV